MKTKRMVHFTLALSLMGAWATVAHAESFSVEVPFAFEAAGKTFPAGAYTVDSSTSGVLMIHGASSAAAAAIMVSPAQYTTNPRSSLVFDKSPGNAVLSSVNLVNGLTLTVAPVKRLTATLTLPSKGSVVLSRP